MFRITSTIFNEVNEIEGDKLIGLYESGTLEDLAYFFTNEIDNNINQDNEPTYLDLTQDELVQDWLEGTHRIMKINCKGLLYEALGFVYGSYDGIEIAKKNQSLAIDNENNLYFFCGYNYDYINELFKDIGGRQAFLTKLNNGR